MPGGTGQLESLSEEEKKGRKIMSRESYYQMLRRSDALATGKNNLFARLTINVRKLDRFYSIESDVLD